MKQCRECGALSNDDTVFCYICGTRFAESTIKMETVSAPKSDCAKEKPQSGGLGEQQRRGNERHGGAVLIGFGSEKINVIKVIRNITGMGLAEAKTFVESCPSELKASAAQIAELRAAGAVVEYGADTGEPVYSSDAAVTSKPVSSSDSVRILNFGPEKIKAIKLVREITGMGLVEAKTFVENCPSELKANVAQIELLRSIGAVIV
jgi:large subunit ribosomal protein L7/L12